jgi:hypothetical protein
MKSFSFYESKAKLYSGRNMVERESADIQRENRTVWQSGGCKEVIECCRSRLNSWP